MQPDVIQEFLNDLRRNVTGDVRTDAYSVTLYSTDASIYQVKPYGVLIPRSVEDVQAAVEAAAKFRVPILPRAAGSSPATSATPVLRAITARISHSGKAEMLKLL